MRRKQKAALPPSGGIMKLQHCESQQIILMKGQEWDGWRGAENVKGFHKETDVKGYALDQRQSTAVVEMVNQHIGNLTGGQIAPRHQRTKMRKGCERKERFAVHISRGHLGHLGCLIKLSFYNYIAHVHIAHIYCTVHTQELSVTKFNINFHELDHFCGSFLHPLKEQSVVFSALSCLQRELHLKITPLYFSVGWKWVH